MNAKPFYMSKTLWVNALSLVVLALTYAIDHQMFTQYSGVFASALAFLNLVLRFFTNSAVTVNATLPPTPNTPLQA